MPKLPDLPTGIDAYLSGAKNIPAMPPSGPKAAELIAESKEATPPAQTEAKKARATAPAKKTAAKAQKAKEPASAKPSKPKKPWDDIDPKLMKPFSSRIFVQLDEQLQAVATRKTPITTILNNALRKELAILLKERGLK